MRDLAPNSRGFLISVARVPVSEVLPRARLTRLPVSAFPERSRQSFQFVVGDGAARLSRSLRYVICQLPERVRQNLAKQSHSLKSLSSSPVAPDSQPRAKGFSRAQIYIPSGARVV